MSIDPLDIQVRNIINKYDPIHLLDIGCPEDEYDGEARRITKKLKSSRSFEQLLTKVYEVFVYMFDKKLAGSKYNYKQLTQELFQLKNLL